MIRIKVTKRPYIIPDDVYSATLGLSVYLLSSYMEGYKPYVNTPRLTRFIRFEWSYTATRRLYIDFKLYCVKDPEKVRIEQAEKRCLRAGKMPVYHIIQEKHADKIDEILRQKKKEYMESVNFLASSGGFDKKKSHE